MAGYLFDLDHLQMRITAPELSALDQNGVPFKLTDARGMTTVLVFWTTRSRPSLEVIDQLLRIEEEHRGGAFRVIGVVGDGTREKTAPLLEKAGIRFTNAFDGDTEGPLDRAWNVYAWPMVYVLDRDGVIRFRHVQKKGLEEAVNSLTGIPQSAPSPGK